MKMRDKYWRVLLSRKKFKYKVEMICSLYYPTQYRVQVFNNDKMTYNQSFNIEADGVQMYKDMKLLCRKALLEKL